MIRDGATGRAWGQEPPKNSRSPQLPLEFLKIAMHYRHFLTLLFMFLESLIEFLANQKGVTGKNFACFARCRHFDNFCPPAFSSLAPSLAMMTDKIH